MSGLNVEFAEIMLKQSQTKDRRVDRYLAQLRDFLSKTPEWSKEHSDVFNEMIKEVRRNRWMSNGAYIVTLLLIVTIVAYHLVLVP